MAYKWVKENHVMDDPKDIIRHLDIDGNLIDKNYKTKLTKGQLIEGYKLMVLSREQDKFMSTKQLVGQMLTFAPNFGEEGLQVASAMAMDKKIDWLVPAFRSNASMLYMGVPLKSQLLYWNGQEKGSVFPKDVNVLPINITIGCQTTHAVGIAYAMKMQKKKGVSVSFIGNGGTAEGEFYEALNWSKIHKLPTVFGVNNNQWSISTPEYLETGSTTIAAKAKAAGMPGVRVDGNDFLASYEVMKEAMDWAREGKGPVLVEFYTWRQGKHTTSDNPRIYRSEEVEKENEKWEPFHRIENYMKSQKMITDKDIEDVLKDSKKQVKEAFEESIKPELLNSTIDEIFDHTYAEMPPELAEQKAEAIEFHTKEGK